MSLCVETIKQNQSNEIPVWDCLKCTYTNVEKKSVCAVCNSSYFEPDSSWICSKCSYCNNGKHNKCKNCKYDKSLETKEDIEFSDEKYILNTKFLRQHAKIMKCPNIYIAKNNESIGIRKVHIVHISDTHRKFKEFTSKIPFKKDCINILIHSGDFSGKFEKNKDETVTLPKRLVYFSQWFRNLPHQTKIIISGNHDYVCSELTKEQIQTIVFKNDKNVIYLQDEMIDVHGIKIYGTPWNHRKRMSFGAHTSKMKRIWKMIPNNCDILVTHQPPFSEYLNKLLCKESRGNVDLWNEIINRIEPKVHLFGHDHDYNGWRKYEETVFINSAMDWTNRKIPCVAHEFDVIFK
eukprot:554969_1